MVALSPWLILVGVLILASSFIDFSYLVSKLFSISKNKVVATNKAEGFLEIVSLWYQLKSKCEEYNLSVASDKLDEVFPLLNKVIEE